MRQSMAAWVIAVTRTDLHSPGVFVMCNVSSNRRIESVNVYVLPVPVVGTVGEFLPHLRYTINRIYQVDPI
jgi:hypothetical protein